MAQARPAPNRSAKYSRPIWAVRRPNSVASMMPMLMNEANSARQITTSSARLPSDAPLP